MRSIYIAFSDIFIRKLAVGDRLIPGCWQYNRPRGSIDPLQVASGLKNPEEHYYFLQNETALPPNGEKESA